MNVTLSNEVVIAGWVTGLVVQYVLMVFATSDKKEFVYNTFKVWLLYSFLYPLLILVINILL